MTDKLTRCFACQAEVSATSSVCSECGAVLGSHASWPDWHGNPEHGDLDQGGWLQDEVAETDASSAFEPLALDPALVDVHPGHPGQRRLIVGLAISGVVWLLVGLLYEVVDPPNWWDIVWYAAGTLTGVLVVWLLVSLIRRTRTHGFGPALRWLLS
ncbi:MAG TPA: hypothetical protein VEW66_06500 [Thermomicrobiales bacterium]|nr:hypothetical protein [Thermomicrobiales bacterium]